MSRLVLWLTVLVPMAYLTVVGQARPEGAMGTYPVPPAIAMTGGEAVTWTVEIKPHDTYDPSGVQFFALVFPDGTRAVVSVDADLPFAQALERFKQQKVRLVLDPLTLERLSR